MYDGATCVGWCQFGSPSELPRIKSLKEYEKGLTDLPDWRIACNFVGKGHRRIVGEGLLGLSPGNAADPDDSISNVEFFANSGGKTRRRGRKICWARSPHL